jgi:D-arabinono-1,4-lactone oxidase
LEKAMADSDYLHLNWFPQSSVNRVTEWVGKRTYKFGKVKPYRNQLRGKRKNIAAAIALEIMDQATNIDPEHAESIISAILNKFVPVSGPGSKSTFSDVWYDALPSDDQYETDTLLKVILMEVWIPMDKLEEALSRLKELFEHEPGAAGYFITELYGAKRSPFWLSPAYDRNVFRVDVFSWAHALHAQKAARKHFKFYWDALLDLDARLHWGKVLPKVNQQCGKVKFNPAFLRNAYPKLPKWLEFRRGMDPNGIFLSDYWKDILGIP